MDMHATQAAHPSSRNRAVTTTSRDFDDCVLRIAADRDRQAFATLFDHYAPRVKALLMRSGSPPAAAEELAQETLLSVWRKAHLFNPERASSAAWIFTIARNLRIDSLRRGDASVYAADLALAADEPEQPDAILSGAQDAELVRAAMRTLNPDQARAIEMAFFHEQTHTQISQALGVPLGTVKARIRFGMMKLRAFIERDGGGAA
ncbi:RNA polymerase subunit sigma [Caulobacter segnis]|uniref:RNA polymerase sigma factor n=2 Tax=Caulobacter segnis TaxID=88688 RepID=D5VMJ7_CAUST|nr:RNA polymerase, sigma-24 subunit, ECF subfamily [Caulobacter segnis ATCC 21756]AVQ03361.1 RNA polymerase subunit sigma [Caulobacter segnis]